MARIECRLTDVGEGLAEAEVLEWLVKVGDEVARDQVVLQIETDKAIVELPAPQDGIVEELSAEEGDVVAVGGLLYVLNSPAAGEPEARAIATMPPELTHTQNVEEPDSERASSARAPAASMEGQRPVGSRVLASPIVRRYAVELGVDIATVTGSGPGGRVTRADLDGIGNEIAPSAPVGIAPDRETAEDPGTVEPLRGARRTMAVAMSASWSQVPHISEFKRVDAFELLRVHRLLRERVPPDKQPAFTLMPLFLRAIASALVQHPILNASIDVEGRTIRYHRHVNLGVATSRDDGLIVPVVRSAQSMSLEQLAETTATLTSEARDKTVAGESLTGGTFTVSNFGAYGGWLGTMLVSPPQVAIAGFGRIADDVMAVDGNAVVRPVLPLSFAADHRLVTGAELGAFATTVAGLLAEPALMLASS